MGFAMCQEIKRYLFILPSTTIGGAERVLFNIVRHLGKYTYNSVQVVFITKSENNDWEAHSWSENVVFKYINERKEFRGFLKYFLCSLFETSKVYNYAVTTHVHTNSFICLLRKLKVLNIKKHIVRESTLIFERFSGRQLFVFKLLYRFYSNIDLLVCQTDEMRLSLLTNVPKLSHFSVRVISNPLNLEFIRCSLNSSYVDTDSESFRILYVGRLHKVKRVDLLLMSVFCLKKISDVNFKLIIVGDGPERARLAELANSLGVQANVLFLGRLDSPYSIMASSDLGILVSEREGFPNVLLEMMCSGTKNIFSTDCTASVLNLPRVNIISSDPDQIANQIHRVILSNSDNSDFFKRYATSYDVDRYCDKLFD
ncbi:glycosyltransferase [Shewanella corallii]|uniref:Glycosyltransferase n=1 Tax=Shewanella corallii TaxID=560080 RepID=A0ABT0N481_9GAMM|nr:glycosyltransferase [Shewanella corallii]MCL2913170.1 glycosyltransferase [Shewanella corallii]